MNKKAIITWILQIIVSLTLLQTLFFKFTGADISVELFSILGVEPWGRFVTGTFELAAGILLLIPQTALMGAILSAIIGFGAILTHLFFIGIDFGGDITLFLMAIGVFVLSLVIIILRKNQFTRFKN